MRRWATSAAVVAFFVMALVGWASGLPLDQCAWKAVVGAAVVFVLVLLAGRAVLRIAVDTVLASLAGRNEKEQTGDDTDDE